MKIIVTGSLGNIGKPLATELVNQGHAVTVISTKPEKKGEIEAIGATAAIGSLEDVDFLLDAFTGADALFAMVPPNYTAPDPIVYYRKIGSNYAAALVGSGIRRVVHLSSYGAHLPQGTGFILGSHHVEGILDGVPGLSLTHLRAGYFYYNLYHFADMIKTAGFIGTNYGGNDKMILVAPVDIAAAAVEELTNVANNHKVRYVVSDDRTASEIAQILGAAIDMPGLKWMTFTDPQTLLALEQNGIPANAAASWVELGASIHSGKLREDYDLNKPAALGKVKLEDFAKEFAVAFNKAE